MKMITKFIINRSNYDYTSPVAYNIFFHIITEDDFTREIEIGEAEIQEAVKLLNVSFNQFNIYFKYRGYQFIPSSFFMEVQMYDVEGIDNSYDDLLLYSQSEGYHKSDAINIYITSAIANGAFQYGGLAYMNRTSLAVLDTTINTKTLSHEMGHCFGLYHTNNTANGMYENVTRDVNDPNYNALTHGDRIHDTPATPLGFQPNTIQNCIWTGIAYDYVGVLYPNILLNNKMGPNPNGCTDNDFLIFTEGQGIRMRWLLNHSYPSKQAVQTTIESLYEPFEVDYVAGDNIISIKANKPADGYATVCRNALKSHRFQKGFTYEFYGVDFNSLGEPIFLPMPNNDPSSATIYEIPEIKYNTFYFGVRILQLDNPFSTFGNYIHPIEVICTMGQICIQEPLIGGKKITTDDLGLQNYTLENLTQEQVADPYFIETLENNKYHIINKTTSSGSETQEIIYKQQ